MRALVTGSSGFIGQHLVRSLQKHSAVTNVLLRNSNNLKKVHNINVFQGDIFDTDILGKSASLYRRTNNYLDNVSLLEYIIRHKIDNYYYSY